MSDFGKGFIYCLNLWSQHFENEMARKPFEDNYSLWIYAASDHLFELEIPENLPKELKLKCESLRNIALDYGHGENMMQLFSKEDFLNIRNLTNEICQGIDKWLNVSTEEATWK